MLTTYMQKHLQITYLLTTLQNHLHSSNTISSPSDILKLSHDYNKQAALEQYRDWLLKIPSWAAQNSIKCPTKQWINFVGLAQGLPQSYLQYTDNPLHNTVMTHSTVKCPKQAYHKEQKNFERAILSGLLRDYRKATCSTPTTHF